MAVPWLHERDSLMDPALYLKEQVEPVHEVIDARSLGACPSCFQAFEHRYSDLMILTQQLSLRWILPTFL